MSRKAKALNESMIESGNMQKVEYWMQLIINGVSSVANIIAVESTYVIINIEV